VVVQPVAATTAEVAATPTATSARERPRATHPPVLRAAAAPRKDRHLAAVLRLRAETTVRRRPRAAAMTTAPTRGRPASRFRSETAMAGVSTGVTATTATATTATATTATATATTAMATATTEVRVALASPRRLPPAGGTMTPAPATTETAEGEATRTVAITATIPRRRPPPLLTPASPAAAQASRQGAAGAAAPAAATSQRLPSRLAGD
jgi:hypothetical protein